MINDSQFYSNFVRRMQLLKPGTKRAYEQVLKGLLLAAGKKYPGEITPEDICQWEKGLRAAGLAETTIRQRVAIVRSLYRVESEPTPEALARRLNRRRLSKKAVIEVRYE
jgi:hypothetical protein